MIKFIILSLKIILMINMFSTVSVASNNINSLSSTVKFEDSTDLIKSMPIPEKKNFTGKSTNGKQKTFYKLNFKEFKDINPKEIPKCVRTPASGKGQDKQMVNSGDHEIYKTSMTALWFWMSNQKGKFTLNAFNFDNKNLKEIKNIQHIDDILAKDKVGSVEIKIQYGNNHKTYNYDYKKAQEDIRMPTKSIYFKRTEGSHSGALYKKFDQDNNKLTSFFTEGQHEFHKGQLTTIMKSSNPLGATVRSLKYHINETKSTLDLVCGKNMADHVYDVYGTNIGRKGPPLDKLTTRRYASMRNGLKIKYYKFKDLLLTYNEGNKSQLSVDSEESLISNYDIITSYFVKNKHKCVDPDCKKNDCVSGERVAVRKAKYNDDEIEYEFS